MSANQLRDMNSCSMVVLFLGAAGNRPALFYPLWIQFIVCFTTVQEAVWLERFLGSLRVPSALSLMTIHCDSMAAIAYTKDPKYHGRTKHINMKNNYIRDLIAQKEVIVEHIYTSHMVVDPLTKPIPRDAYVTHVKSLGLCRW